MGVCIRLEETKAKMERPSCGNVDAPGRNLGSNLGGGGGYGVIMTDK